jgi:hypothetical protein
VNYGRFLEKVGAASADLPVKVVDEDGKALSVRDVEVKQTRQGGHSAIVVTVKAG